MAPSHPRKVRIVLQARTSSSRQPAKSLLPLGGIPLAILCAKRLQRSGLEVLLATSDDPSDDILTATAEHAGVAVFRGHLTDVLGRFIASTTDLEDDDVIVRMTADNPVPDGDFVVRLIDAFWRKDVSYLGTRWPDDGLPYGVGGEVFTAGALRRAGAAAVAPHEREHVTPFLAEMADVGGLTTGDLPELESDRASLRCTIDTLEDYLAIARVFEMVDDPVQVDWRELVSLLPDLPHRNTETIPSATRNGECYGRIILGTAQFGMEYGITNQTGCPSDDGLRAILRSARTAGVTHLDTARGYGVAEARIGKLTVTGELAGLRVISKLAPLPEWRTKVDASAIVEAVDASVFRSCHALRRRRIDVMMFHRFDDMLQCNGAAVDRLVALVKEGILGGIGVSVYTPDEAIRSLADSRIEHIQIPFNLLDHRWLSEDFQSAIRARPSVTIHARSVFLQGLLINSATVWPSWFRHSEAFVAKIGRLCADLGRLSPADLCMAYVSAFPWIFTMVLGVERLEQFEELVGLAARTPLSTAEVDIVRTTFCAVPSRLLNPAKW